MNALKLQRLFIWCWMAPQELMGAGLFLILGRRSRLCTEYLSISIRAVDGITRFSGVALGTWVFINAAYLDESANAELIIKHEYGHYLQSRILGPFYLLIVGLPSLLFNLFSRLSSYKRLYGRGNGIFSTNYYRRFPENWADKLGGVRRE